MVQRTRPDLQSEINTNFADNTTGQIEPIDARTTYSDMLDSWQMIASTTVGNVAYTILGTDRYVHTSTTLSAPRTWTLPAANSFNKGEQLLVADAASAVNGANVLSVIRGGSDTINGGTAGITITTAGGAILFASDGVSNWSGILSATGGGGGGTPGGTSSQVQFNNSGAFGGSAGLTLNPSTVLTSVFADGALTLNGATSGSSVVKAPATGGGTLTLPSGTDTLVGAASTATLTNKTYDTAGTGNVFKIAGTQISSVSGNTSKVPLLSGTVTSGHVAAFDASGNIVDGGTLSGGGNVSNSGTPASPQLAQWVTSTTIQGITGTTATALFDVFTTTLKGLVPGSGGGTVNFLRADGTWAAPPGGGSFDVNAPHTWGAPQTPGIGTLTSGSGSDFSVTGQTFTAAVSGAFTISNPTANPATGTYVSIVISMTAAGAVSFGTNFKGLANYVQSTWSSGTLRDHLVFRWDGSTYNLVGVANGVNL